MRHPFLHYIWLLCSAVDTRYRAYRKGDMKCGRLWEENR